MKRESARFHSTWVKEKTPAMESVAGQVDKVPVAVEVAAGMLWQPCLARHRNKGHANLEGHIFTIGSGNKGKDGDMLHTSKEKMATYIGTKHGDDAAQEWTSKKRTVLPKSTAILDRHAERVQAMRDQVNLKHSSLQQESLAIDNEIKQAPTDRKLMTEKKILLIRSSVVKSSSRMSQDEADR
jgi:hypothetical protein